MRIENNSVYIPPLSMQTSRPATNANLEQESTSKASGNQKTVATDSTNPAAVVAAPSNNLAKETISHLISATQETDTSNANSEEYQGILSESERRHLEQVANDSGYAKQMSESIGTAQDLVRIHESQMPKNGGDPAYAKAFYERLDGLQLKASEVGDKRTSFYKSQVNQGISPAQIYANLMEFNATQSQDYWDSMSIGFEKSNQTTKRFQASHDYLQNLIDRSMILGHNEK